MQNTCWTAFDLLGRRLQRSILWFLGTTNLVVPPPSGLLRNVEIGDKFCLSIKYFLYVCMFVCVLQLGVSATEQ